MNEKVMYEKKISKLRKLTLELKYLKSTNNELLLWINSRILSYSIQIEFMRTKKASFSIQIIEFNESNFLIMNFMIKLYQILTSSNSVLISSVNPNNDLKLIDFYNN